MLYGVEDSMTDGPCFFRGALAGTFGGVVSAGIVSTAGKTFLITTVETRLSTFLFISCGTSIGSNCWVSLLFLFLNHLS